MFKNRFKFEAVFFCVFKTHCGRYPRVGLSAVAPSSCVGELQQMPQSLTQTNIIKTIKSTF